VSGYCIEHARILNNDPSRATAQRHVDCVTTLAHLRTAQRADDDPTRRWDCNVVSKIRIKVKKKIAKNEKKKKTADAKGWNSAPPLDAGSNEGATNTEQHDLRTEK